MLKSKSGIVKRSLMLYGHKTSISLEDDFWISFKFIAADQGLTHNRLAEQIDNERGRRNLSSTIRVFVLRYWREHAEKYEKAADVAAEAPLAPNEPM